MEFTVLLVEVPYFLAKFNNFGGTCFLQFQGCPRMKREEAGSSEIKKKSISLNDVTSYEIRINKNYPNTAPYWTLTIRYASFYVPVS